MVFIESVELGILREVLKHKGYIFQRGDLHIAYKGNGFLKYELQVCPQGDDAILSLRSITQVARTSVPNPRALKVELDSILETYRSMV